MTPELTDDEITSYVPVSIGLGAPHEHYVKVAHAAMRKALWWAVGFVDAHAEYEVKHQLERRLQEMGIEPWEE